MLTRRGVQATARLAALSLLLSCARTPPPAPQATPNRPLDLPDETWVHNTLTGMSLEERVGQMLMPRLEGGFENLRGDAMREAQRLLQDAHVGGFLVEHGTPLDVAAKLNALQRQSRTPLMFAASMEWGAGSQLPAPPNLPQGVQGSGGTIFPYNMGIAATGDPSLAELAGRVTAVEARAVGIHWLLAPVVDVNTLPDNPFNVRSYGSDPVTVGTFASAFIRGAAAAGALTAAKHFPGHGASRVDPYAGLPVVHATKDVLDARELRPFRAAIFAGVSAIMVGHIAVPSLTAGTPIPATVAPELSTELLRGRLGYRGLVITDVMSALPLREVAGWSPGELVVRAVEAGADVVLSPLEPVYGHQALVEAVRSGRIHYSRVDSSVARILRAKAQLRLHRERTVPLDSVMHVVGAPEHEIVAADIAARSLTLARDSAVILPLDPRRVSSIALIAYAPTTDVTAGAELAEELTKIYGRAVTFTRIDENSSASLVDSASARAGRADATVLATFLPPMAGQAGSTAPEALRRLAVRIRHESRRVAVVSFGDPYAPATLAGSSTYLLAWQPKGGAAQRAAARALAGRVPIPGKLPIELPRATASRGLDRAAEAYGLELARPEDVGMDSRQLARVDSIILAGIVEGAAPGVVLAVGRQGRLVRLRGYGTLDRRRGFASVDDSTLYDMASVTKPVATTTAIMMLLDDGLLSLSDSVSQFLPEWRNVPRKQDITVRHLLLHQSGLPAYAPLWRDLTGREQYRRRITAMSLEYEPGTRTVYSDFGFILLGLIVEHVSGQELDVFLRDRLFRPLGMRDTGFNPLQWPYVMMEIDGDTDITRAAPDPIISRIAPTEVDTVFRDRHIRGWVHDENAFAMGGVAGHAGLFSSGRDMAIFAQMMLNRGFYGGQRYIDPATVELFTRRHEQGSSRALGWDTPEGTSSAGAYFSASSFGHTGFTGPSIWVDPERDLFVVLLMNRVNPTRDNQRHARLRRDVADAVQRAIVDRPLVPRERIHP